MRVVTSWQPTVAVVVPVYNAVRTIDECVRSLLELRYPAEIDLRRSAGN